MVAQTVGISTTPPPHLSNDDRGGILDKDREDGNHSESHIVTNAALLALFHDLP
jgi:hypothetical protein